VDEPKVFPGLNRAWSSRAAIPAGKGFVEEISKSIEPANRLWKLTAAGRDFLIGELKTK
jgi:hypothetical protein